MEGREPTDRKGDTIQEQLDKEADTVTHCAIHPNEPVQRRGCLAEAVPGRFRCVMLPRLAYSPSLPPWLSRVRAQAM